MTLLVGVAGVIVVILVVAAMIVSTPRQTLPARRATAYDDEGVAPGVTSADTAR